MAAEHKPRTIAGVDSSGHNEHLTPGSVEIMRYRILSTIAWHIGRLKILTGIAALAGATAILALSSGRRTDNQNSQMSLRLIPLILAALSLFFFTEASGLMGAKRNSETVRTG